MSHTLESLDARLAALADQIKQTTHLIQRLSKHSPSAGTSASRNPPPASEGTTPPSLQRSDTGSNLLDRTELAADIHDALKQHEEALEWLQLDVEDAGGSTARGAEGLGMIGRFSGGAAKRRSGFGTGEKEVMLGRVSEGCNRLQQELKIARIRFRKAQLQAKRNEDDATQAEQAAYLADLQAAAAQLPSESQDVEQSDAKEQNLKPAISLFGNRRGPRRDPNATQADILLNATSDITSSLRRTHALLTSELSRSRFAKETLDTSNEALKELNERYASLDNLLSKSRGLLGTLLRSQKSDTWYLETTVYILLATIGWLVFRKLLYGPVTWFVIWPLKLFWRISLGVIGIAGVTGGTSAVSSAAGVSSARVGNIADGIPHHHQSIEAADGHDSGETLLSGSMNQRVTRIIDAGAAASQTGSSKDDSVQQDATGNNNSETQDHDLDNQPDAQRGDNQPVRRGDGQALQERDEKAQPRNPKKRMMEGDGGQQRRDEL